MAENVKVIVRCRPMNKKEKDMECNCVVKIQNCVIEIWDPGDGQSFPKQFTFDSTYDQTSTTEIIYNDICYPLIESILDGYNATVFVYGQTGCGKSHTMEGIKCKDSPDKGVISRAFEHIFEAIAVTSGVKYLALISYLEIYNEQVRDLLLSTDKITSTNTLSLKETPTEGITVPGLTCHPVHDASECEYFLNMGSKNRMIGTTLMNQNSSRSHSIFTISIEQISLFDNNESIRKGKLNLVDLAGSERQAKTGATGDRLKEATKINLSLSALGNVISALVDGKAKHIPYRDSKLTRLLQDSLGGNTRTLMIACISPSSRDYMETLSTLRYANRAKNIYNKPKVNEDPKDAILRQYQEEISRLKNLLETKTIQLGIEDISGFTDISTIDTKTEINENINSSNRELDKKRDRLLQDYQEEMKKLKNLHEIEKHEKENILKQIEAIKRDYQINIEKLNEEIEFKHKKELCSNEEIVKRIAVLKASMIGGERANDKELSERRRKKKKDAENRASLIAQVLAKIDMIEDREILQNQYKDITQELNLKTDALRKYRHKVKSLEKELLDIHSEFQMERDDYLETIRKQDQSIKLLSQISDKIVKTVKRECNYSDLESIKEQAVWLDETQKYKLPELITSRTKLPPPGRICDIQTAPARLLSQSISFEDDNNSKQQTASTPDKEDLICSYFQPTRKRAGELLGQSRRLDTSAVFNTWRDFARRNKVKSSDNLNQLLTSSPQSKSNVTNSYHGLNNVWLNGTTSLTNESNLRKPFLLEALPDINKNRNQRLNTLEFI